ncbi:MAG: hypothetical protein JO107_10905 [Hyphomicrobiales bacterium]|nr:hypothetical protein [Hyphomicrobiales bacterium]
MAAFSPAYWGFHRWLSANMSKVKSGRAAVIYSGMDAGKPIWKKLDEYEKELKLYFRIKPTRIWETLAEVATGITTDIGGAVSRADYERALQSKTINPGVAYDALRQKLKKYKSLYDFAENSARNNDVTAYEKTQIWKNLSARYVQNASGHVYIFEGDVLKKYPDFLLAEIPVLMKNKRVDAATIARAVKLVPKSKDAWLKYRDKSETAEGRLKGR